MYEIHIHKDLKNLEHWIKPWVGAETADEQPGAVPLRPAGRPATAAPTGVGGPKNETVRRGDTTVEKQNPANKVSEHKSAT